LKEKTPFLKKAMYKVQELQLSGKEEGQGNFFTQRISHASGTWFLS
jgi:hypothetical protein